MPDDPPRDPDDLTDLDRVLFEDAPLAIVSTAAPATTTTTRVRATPRTVPSTDPPPTDPPPTDPPPTSTAPPPPPSSP